MDLFSKCQKETMDNLDQANQEIERLRKYIDKQQSELQGLLGLFFFLRKIFFYKIHHFLHFHI